MFNLENDFDLLKVNMMDNGDWEYTRLGIGEDVDGKVFLVDTDDHGYEEVVMNFCKEGLTIKDVLKIGVACKVFEKIDWGYDEDDQHFFNAHKFAYKVFKSYSFANNHNLVRPLLIIVCFSII
jgi:hypothetical protein